MAVSLQSNAYAFPAEVARFLAVEPADVKRMQDLDGMPFTTIAKATRTVRRVYLPALHEWLLKQSRGESGEMMSYVKWLAEFDRCRGGETFKTGEDS